MRGHEIERVGKSDPCDVRCDCGCLLARKVGDMLELKCRRCKRVVGIAKIVSAAAGCTCIES